MLLLWLYVSNGAILIGGEMNSEIEKTVTGRPDPARGGSHLQDASDPTKNTFSAAKR